MEGTHPCSRASLPMRWSVDGRHPPLGTLNPRFVAWPLELGAMVGRYIHVAGINRGPCVLKHKYHRHWNHGRPWVGFWGILGVPSIEPLLGGGVRPEGSIPPPPRPGNENPASPVLNQITG